MPNVYHVPDVLILPFGRAVKDDLQKVNLSAVSADGLYFSTNVPVLFVRTSDRKPVNIGDFEKVFGAIPFKLFTDEHKDDTIEDDIAILEYMCATIKSHNPNMTKSEELFLELYFEMLRLQAGTVHGNYNWDIYEQAVKLVGDFHTYKSRSNLWRSLLPIPEVQLYVRDPLAQTEGYQPHNNFRVDYGFWNGANLIAVGIDGAEPAGYARDIRRDRLLRRAGVDVIHILNIELERHKLRALHKLLPSKFFGHDWDYEGVRPAPDIPF